MSDRTTPGTDSTSSREITAIQGLCEPDDLACQVRDIGQMELLDTLLSAMPIFVMLVNPGRRVVYANQALISFLGVERQALIGRHPGDVLLCEHAQDDAACGATGFCAYCGANRALAEGLAGEACVEECRIVRDTALDPPALDLRVWSSPLTLDGEPFVLLAAEDISDEKRRQILERAFFHDILNTATILDGAANLLLSEAHVEDDAAARRIVGSASARLIDEIVNQRDLSEMESNSLQPEADEVDALTFLEGLLLSYAAHELTADRVLSLARESEATRIAIDKALLGRVLGNLLKNAIEASDPGATITIGCRRVRQDQIEFWVHNAAVMPEDVRLQIFERSFSTKGSGRGIGTYSVKLLTERYLEGSVSFTSRSGEGTTFRVRYPRTPTYADRRASRLRDG